MACLELVRYSAKYCSAMLATIQAVAVTGQGHFLRREKLHRALLDISWDQLLVIDRLEGAEPQVGQQLDGQIWRCLIAWRWKTTSWNQPTWISKWPHQTKAVLHLSPPKMSATVILNIQGLGSWTCPWIVMDSIHAFVGEGRSAVPYSCVHVETTKH